MVPSRYFGSCSLIFILVCKAAWQNVPSTAEFNTVARETMFQYTFHDCENGKRKNDLKLRRIVE